MARQQSKALGALLVVLALAVGGALWWIVGATGEPIDAGAVVAPGPGSPAGTAAPSTGGRDAAGSAELTAPTDVDPTKSTVAWPVKIELELVTAARYPRNSSVKPYGSGATARLSGRIFGRSDTGVPALIEFRSGSNAGRVLQAGPDGSFGANDLYPGLAEVLVSGPGLPGSVREVRLRQNADTELNISYGLPGSISGYVFGVDEEPLADVTVELEGRFTTTNEEGEFGFTSMTAGRDMQLVLTKDGYASHAERVAVPAGRAVRRDRYKFRLEPAATLDITIRGNVGSPGPAQVVLLPSLDNIARSYPWHRLNPIEVTPGRTKRVENLPADRLVARVFRAGAIADPEEAIITLRAGKVGVLDVRLEPAPKVFGTVVDADGRPAVGATVRFEAPDRVAATMQFLGKMPIYLETEVVPALPVAVEEAVTGRDGAFTFSAWPKYGAARYLTASSADGLSFGARIVRFDPEADPAPIELALAPLEETTGALAITFPRRHQGLPVVVTVHGDPRAEVVLPPDEPLTVDGLAEGTWRIRASWNGKALQTRRDGDPVDVFGEARYAIELPPGAIEGQDEDTLLRAGRLDGL